MGKREVEEGLLTSEATTSPDWVGKRPNVGGTFDVTPLGDAGEDFSLIFTSQNLQKYRFLRVEHYFVVNNDKNPVLEETPNPTTKPTI